MAGLEPRANGAYRVHWREQGKKQSETFDNIDGARAFRRKVERAGNHWPPGWAPRFGADPMGSTAPGTPTLRAWADTSMARRTEASARTRADNLRDLGNNAFGFVPVPGGPTLGDYPLDTLSKDHLAAWIIALKKGDLADKTVRNLHGTLAGILSEAVTEGHLTRTPLTKLGRGYGKGVRTEQMNFLTPDEFGLLLSHVPAHYQPLVTFLVGTGLRWGEATALSPVAVDVFSPRKTVLVSRAWKRDEDNGFYLGEPKSSASRRTIVLDPVVLGAITPLLSGRTARDFLFTTKTGASRPVLHANFYNRVWVPAVAAARADGLAKAPRIHDLRHTHVAWLIRENTPAKAIAARLGHSSISITMDRYGHLMPELDDEISATISEALTNRPALRAVPSP